MLQYMLDTDTCIYVNKELPPTLAGRFNRLADQICISTITEGELYFGAENSSRPAANRVVLERFTGRLTVLPFSSSAASHYGQIRLDLQKAGKPIGPYDLLIAAHARSEGLILVTNNTREFKRVKGLRIENWT